MINTIWKDNELYNLLLSNIDDIEKAQEMFNCILPYLLNKYEKDKITINSLLIVMPEDLYDCMKTVNKSYYMDLVSIICMYKLQTNCDIGFTMKRYEDAYNKKLQFEKILEQKQQMKEQRKQSAKERKLAKRQPVVLNEDFDKKLLINEKNIINYIKTTHNNVKFLKESDLSKMAKNLYNYRYGKLIYNHPFINNDIKDMSVYWIGMCDCGNYRVTQAGRIKDYTSCGRCDEPEHIYIGEKYGHLTCIDQKYVLAGKHSLKLQLKCKCDCGSVIILNPLEFSNDTKHYCNKKCKYAIKHRSEIGNQNGKNIKSVFYKNTNVGKLGRISSNSNSSTGYLGVTFLPKLGKYMAYITFQHKPEVLGYYDKPETAYKVRVEAQNMLHKQFLGELDENDFVHDNIYLQKLLNKVKKAVRDNTKYM